MLTLSIQRLCEKKNLKHGKYMSGGQIYDQRHPNDGLTDARACFLVSLHMKWLLGSCLTNSEDRNYGCQGCVYVRSCSFLFRASPDPETWESLRGNTDTNTSIMQPAQTQCVYTPERQATKHKHWSAFVSMQTVSMLSLRYSFNNQCMKLLSSHL